MTESEPNVPSETPPQKPEAPDAAMPPGFDPQAMLAQMSIAKLEADLQSLMGERMSQLDDMLANLESLVERIETDIDRAEGLQKPPTEDPPQ